MLEEKYIFLCQVSQSWEANAWWEKTMLHLCLIASPQYLSRKMTYRAQTHITLATTWAPLICKALLQFSPNPQCLQIQQHIMYFPGPLWMFSHAIWHGQCWWSTKTIAIWSLKIRFDKLSQEKAWLDKNRFNPKFHNWIQTIRLTESWKLGLWILHT